MRTYGCVGINKATCPPVYRQERQRPKVLRYLVGQSVVPCMQAAEAAKAAALEDGAPAPNDEEEEEDEEPEAQVNTAHND